MYIFIPEHIVDFWAQTITSLSCFQAFVGIPMLFSIKRSQLSRQESLNDGMDCYSGQKQFIQSVEGLGHISECYAGRRNWTFDSL